MNAREDAAISSGTVVEFFEAKQVLCAVCLTFKNQRLAVLTEQNREINLARSRLIHIGSRSILAAAGRDDMAQQLVAIAGMRKELMQQVNIEELWSLLEGEEEGFDAAQLAEFIFSNKVSDHHAAAVQRVLLQDRIYFQYKDGQFFARSQEKIEQRRQEMDREAERAARLIQGAQWLRSVWQRKNAQPTEEMTSVVDGLKSFCLYAQESPQYTFVKELLQKAEIPPYPNSAFRILTRLGIWREDENLYLHQHNIIPEFSPVIEQLAAEQAVSVDPSGHFAGRCDLRHLDIFTIDGAVTRDYDDALSLRQLAEDRLEVGIHIADAAQFVQPGDPLDQEALERATSIYLPDRRIPMLPTSLSEGVCSLYAGKDRLALSFLVQIDPTGNILESQICPSVIRVKRQMTYQEVDDRVEQDPTLQQLYRSSLLLRQTRLAHGAIILPLPEINVYVNSLGMIQISRYQKETPSQSIVSEWMIVANTLAASYLAERDIPAIFRSQAECKPETNPVQSEHELFRIYRQRRLFARAELDTKPGMHCSLAIPHYTSITSPIRRYIDLIVQRQLKFALENTTTLYSEEDLRRIIIHLGPIQSKIYYIQRKWVRYWILKYFEQEGIHALNALVLDQNDRFVHLLLADYLIETNMPLPEKTRLQAGEMVRLRIERLNPRDDVLRLQI